VGVSGDKPWITVIAKSRAETSRNISIARAWRADILATYAQQAYSRIKKKKKKKKKIGGWDGLLVSAVSYLSCSSDDLPLLLPHSRAALPATHRFTHHAHALHASCTLSMLRTPHTSTYTTSRIQHRGLCLGTHTALPLRFCLCPAAPLPRTLRLRIFRTLWRHAADGKLSASPSRGVGNMDNGVVLSCRGTVMTVAHPALANAVCARASVGGRVRFVYHQVCHVAASNSFCGVIALTST